MPSNELVRFEYMIDGTPIGVRSLLIQLVADLGKERIGAGALTNVEIVFAEVLNNIVEHAYRDDLNGKISATVQIMGTCLLFQTEDFGVAMPQNRLPRIESKDLSVDVISLPEGGFGWNLIHELTQELRYRRIDERNMLKFSIKI